MKNKILYVLCTVCLYTACVKSSDPDPKTPPDTIAVVDTVPAIQWQKCLGGTNTDIANAVQPTTDGGYIIAGSTLSNDGNVTGNHGMADYWVVKLNNTGGIAWQKTFGGSAKDVAYSVKQTSDGGYIVAGQTFSEDGDVTNNESPIGGSYWVIKLSGSGALQWQRCLALNTIGCGANAIQQTADGGYIVAGDGYALRPTMSYGDVLIIKLGSGGGMEWSSVLGGGYHDHANAIQQTTDGGYIIAGATASTDDIFSVNHNLGNATYDYYIAKISATGNIQWQQIYGGKENDVAYAVQQTKDGGYLVAGYASSSDGTVKSHHGLAPYSDYWLLKLNNSGAILWQKSLGCTNNDVAYAMQQTSDTGFIIAGYTVGATDGDVTFNHNTGTTDCWVVKVDQAGNLKWQQSFGGGSFDEAHAVAQTNDGGYVIAGQTFSNDGHVSGNHGYDDFWILKLK